VEDPGVSDIMMKHDDIDDPHKDIIIKLVAILKEWLPIVQRQLDGLLLAAEKQGGARSLYGSDAWKTASARVDRMRAAITEAEEILKS